MAVIESKENNRVKFNFEIASEDFKKAVNEAYKKNRKYFAIPGFRKGKAPKQIIEMNYGKEIFFEDAINMVLPDAYVKAIDELELEPVEQPEIDIEDEIEMGKAIVVTASVDVKPEVKLGDYSKLEVEKAEREVSETMVDAKLKSIQDMNARIVDAGDKKAENGSILTIDFSGSVDGEVFEGGEAEGYELELGSGSFIPGFEEQLVGKGVDEEVEVKVTFPEEYHAEELAGKEAVFAVKIHEIKLKELPELDDEFAKDVSEFDTLEEYKNSIREELVKDREASADVEEENKIVEAVVEIAEVDIPNGMIESQLDTEVSEFAQRLQMQGLAIDQYYEFTGTNEETLRDQMRESAVSRVKGDLVLEAIAKAEKIEVSEEDRVEELVKLAEAYKQEDTEKFVEDMKKGDLSFLDQALINQKVIDFLKGKVTIK